MDTVKIVVSGAPGPRGPVATDIVLPETVFPGFTFTVGGNLEYDGAPLEFGEFYQKSDFNGKIRFWTGTGQQAVYYQSGSWRVYANGGDAYIATSDAVTPDLVPAEDWVPQGLFTGIPEFSYVLDEGLVENTVYYAKSESRAATSTLHVLTGFVTYGAWQIPYWHYVSCPPISLP